VLGRRRKSFPGVVARPLSLSIQLEIRDPISELRQRKHQKDSVGSVEKNRYPFEEPLVRNELSTGNRSFGTFG
jgi:hypothetical protein